MVPDTFVVSPHVAERRMVSDLTGRAAQVPGRQLDHHERLLGRVALPTDPEPRVVRGVNNFRKQAAVRSEQGRKKPWPPSWPDCSSILQ